MDLNIYSLSRVLMICMHQGQSTSTKEACFHNALCGHSASGQGTSM